MALSPSQTRDLLASLDHHPRKRLGQNFLIDGNIVRKSLHLAVIRKGDLVVEIGPGLGTLTRALLEAGSFVHAVEVDPVLSAHLRETLQPEFGEKLHLIEGDAVKSPRGQIPAGTTDFKVVANLPYAITTPWLEAVLQPPLPSQMVLMMQKEAAARITAQPGSKAYGAISIFIAAAYEKAGVHHVSRSCFHPIPGVDSILLHLQRRQNPIVISREARDLIRRLFTQRRKQIGRQLAKEPVLQEWLERLPEFGASRSSRPEDIPLTAWLHLQDVLREPSRNHRKDHSV